MGKFKVGDRVATNGNTQVNIVKHWNKWFRAHAGKIVDGALVVASVSERSIGLSNKVGKPHFYMPPSTLMHVTLTIEAGKFYKTRDGRKVGPMRRNGALTGQRYWAGKADLDEYTCEWCEDGRFYEWSKDEHKFDLIAEWVEEPAAVVANDNAHAAEQPVAKFKVGQRVKLVREGLSTTGAIGLTAVIESIAEGSKWPFLLRFDRKDLHRFSTVAVTKEYTRAVEADIEHAEAKKPFLFSGGILRADQFHIAGWPSPKKAIVCLIESGQPKPTDRPHVHHSTSAAEREAVRLAGKHKGKEFGVYELVSIKREEVTYEHEWQRLAGKDKAGAIASLKRQAGITTAQARRIVYDLAA